MHDHQPECCAYLSGLARPSQETEMVGDFAGNSPFPPNAAISMPEDGLCLDQSTTLPPSWSDDRQDATPHGWSQTQQLTSANIKTHDSQPVGLGLYENRCASVNDESCFWSPFVDLDGQSGMLEPLGGESAVSAQTCGVLYHLIGGGSDLLADHSSHVPCTAPANRNDENAPSWQCGADEEEEEEHHPWGWRSSTTTTAAAAAAAADTTLPEAHCSPGQPGLVWPGGEQALASSELAATLAPDHSRASSCNHPHPRAWMSTRPGDNNGLLDAPANDDALHVADNTVAVPTAEPQTTSRLRPYINTLLPGPAVELHSAASIPTPAMTDTGDARESVMTTEDISYPSPPSECPGGLRSPVALSSVATMSGQQALPTSPTSVDISKPRLAFKRERDPPKNAAGEFYCDYPDCRDKRRTFRRPCEWNKHMDKHDRPYKCQDPECDKLAGFTYSGGLLRHQREVHKMHAPRQRLMCPIADCSRSLGKGFTRQENLKEHIRRVHGGNDGHGGASASNQAFDKANRRRPSSTPPPAETSRALKRRRLSSDGSQVDDSDDDVHGLREKVRRLRREKQEKDARLDELEAAVKDLRQRVYAA